MATIAIGDIHGCLAPLAALLPRVLEVAGRDDTIVFLGDYIDRGPDSSACIEALVAFSHEASARIVCLQGNHEDWFLRTRDDYSTHSWLFGMEGLDTVRSYSRQAADRLREAMGEAGLRLYLGKCALPYECFFDVMPASHHAFFSSLALTCETADCICSHAGLDPSVQDLSSQPHDALVWGHSSFPLKYSGRKPVVYGHWNNAVPEPDGWPRPPIVGNTIGVDTISHGVLSAIRLPDRTLFQSNGSEVRTLVI